MRGYEDRIYDMNEDDFALILKCLLDRVPIVIAGPDKESVEFFANKLADLMAFRTKLLFYTDFISKNEYDIIVEEESSNYDVQRSIVICPNEASHKALQIFENFRSWIICFHYDQVKSLERSQNNNSRLSFIINLMQKKQDFFLMIENQDGSINVDLIGKKIKISELKFEKLIYDKAIKSVDSAISRMQRIFSQRLISNSDIDNELKEDLLNFSFENNNLKNNFFKIKILEFYNAARRAFAILNKVAILGSLNIEIEINDKTLMDIISYSDASHSRLLEFINAEWNENFNNKVDTHEEKYKDDLIESLWG